MLLAQIEDRVREAQVTECLSIEITELRNRRTGLQAIESQLSFVRRVAQVRLDLLLAAEDVQHDDDVAGRRLDVLLSALPELMRPRPGSSLPRPPAQRAPVRPDEELLAEAERVAAIEIADVTSMSSQEIDDAVRRVCDYERRVSYLRRTLHSLLDDIQSEIARRYRCGELSVT